MCGQSAPANFKVYQDGLAVSFLFNEDGLRSRKTANGVITQYQYTGGKLTYEKRGDINIHYSYDSSGNLGQIAYKSGAVPEYNNTFYPVCNSRGDVVALYTYTGALVARYTYDSWGNVVSITDANGAAITDPNNVGIVNKIRYRGYYWDEDLGMYYLKTRYYDPMVGRFISADGQLNPSAGGKNLFAYCENNPVNLADPDGNCAEHAGKEWANMGSGYYLNRFTGEKTKCLWFDVAGYENYKTDLVKAREKYNYDTVSINNRDPSAPIQVTINPKHEDKEKKGKINPNIQIKNSYEITTRSERRAIMETIMASPEFDTSVFTRSRNSYLREWNGHNRFYSSIKSERLGSVDLNEYPYPEDFLWILTDIRGAFNQSDDF
jgi:RHS repeat-associated protein